MDNQELIQGIKIFGTSRFLKYKEGLLNKTYILNNGTFQIDISFGDVFWSEPAKLLPLEHYNKICISLFDYKEIDRSLLEMKPLEISTPDGNYYKFNFDVRYNPTTPIHFLKDQRFNTQGWDMVPTQDLTNKSWGMIVSLDTMCDIIRYCYRIANVKAFW